MPDTFAPGWDLLLETGEYLSGTGYRALVRQVQIEATIDGADELLIEALARDPTKGVYRIMGETVLAPGNTVVAFAGYGYNLLPLQRFTLLTEEGAYSEGGPPSVKIRGYSAEHRLGEYTAARSWAGPMADSEIVAEIADAHGLSYDGDTVEATDQRTRGRVKAKGTSDLTFLRQLAVANSFGPPIVRYDLDADADVLYWRALRLDDSEALTFTHNPHDSGSDAPTGTLRSFRPTIDLAGLPTKIEISGWDVEKQEPVVVTLEITDGGQDVQVLTGKAAQATGYKIRSGSEMRLVQYAAGQDPDTEKRRALVVPQVTTVDEAVAWGRERLKTINSAAMTGRAVTLGDQTLWVPQVHRFEGLAQHHNGLWLFERCRHILDQSGYRCEADVVRVLEDMTEPTEGS